MQMDFGHRRGLAAAFQSQSVFIRVHLWFHSLIFSGGRISTDKHGLGLERGRQAAAVSKIHLHPCRSVFIRG